MAEGSWQDLIAQDNERADDRRYPDRNIVRRIIEGKGRSTGKLYGYMDREQPESHVAEFRRGRER